LHRYRIGLGASVFAIALLFVAITITYIVRRHTGRFVSVEVGNVQDWQPIAIPFLLWINTGLLAISSVTGEFARRKMFAEVDVMREWLGLGTPARHAALKWLAPTVLLGGAFLSGQYAIWRDLQSTGVFAHQDPASWFFLLLTVTHAIHLLGGICGLGWAGVSNLVMRSLESRQIAVDISVWYWHAMGAIWLYVLAVLLIMN
jgi:cytochrome c oxidase subunit III